MPQRPANWTVELGPVPAGNRRPTKVAPLFRVALAVGALVVMSSYATPGHVVRSELTSAAADLRDLPWGASAGRVRLSLARNFRGQPLAVDASNFPVSVTVTLGNLDRDACLAARRFARRIEGPVVVILDGYGDSAACGEANEMTWRFLP